MYWIVEYRDPTFTDQWSILHTAGISLSKDKAAEHAMHAKSRNADCAYRIAPLQHSTSIVSWCRKASEAMRGRRAIHFDRLVNEFDELWKVENARYFEDVRGEL
jgi:hypothetical protein